MKYLAILLFSSILVSCAAEGTSENSTNDTEEISSGDTISDEDISGIDDEFSVPDELLSLIMLFDSPGNDISVEDEEMLHADPGGRPISPYVTELYDNIGAGHLFVSSTAHGASDLHYHIGYYFTYFNSDGLYVNTKFAPSIDEDYKIEAIQNKFISFQNTYDEWVEDEEGYSFEQTGERITEYTYFVPYLGRLSNIEEVDPSEWPFLRNSLFARHGYIFQAEYYSEHFSEFDWYEPRFTNVDHLMSVEEKKLADFIKSLEDKRNAE